MEFSATGNLAAPMNDRKNKHIRYNYIDKAENCDENIIRSALLSVTGNGVIVCQSIRS